MIRIKGIWHERSEDAPFIGALLSAIDCKYNCKNCFNQHIKDLPILSKTPLEIVNEVKQNKFNQGVILAGLEWTLQPIEMDELIECALDNGLKVMLYTGMEEDNFKTKFPITYTKPIYIKFGRYDVSKKTDTYFMYGVKLASTNQYIRSNKL